jgi:menaquinone-dependent protoporphyrinogen oxidase
VRSLDRASAWRKPGAARNVPSKTVVRAAGKVQSGRTASEGSEAMAKILIVYATTEGQTRKIAEFVADHLTRRADQVTLLDATDARKDLDLSAFDAVFLAASVHMTRHHAAATDFAKAHAAALTELPAAFISVSLHAYGDDPEDEEEARQYVDIFCAETGWLPTAVHYAAGALRFTRYDFFKRWMARQVAKERGITPDPNGDLEFTDWRALTAFVDDFLRDNVPGA